MNFLNDPLKVAADWLMGIFTGWGMPEIAAQRADRLSRRLFA